VADEIKKGPASAGPSPKAPGTIELGDDFAGIKDDDGKILVDDTAHFRAQDELRSAPREAWDDLEDKLDQAIDDVMLTDRWRDTPNLVILRDVITMDAPLPAKVKAKRLLELLEIPLRDLGDLQRHELAQQLLGVYRFVCRRGHDD
jgi:hypothetical protein